MQNWITLKYLWVCLGLLAGLILCTPLFGHTATELDQELARARENLRLSMASQERIESQLRSLEQAGLAEPEVVADYQVYLSKIEAMVQENSRLVRQLQSLKAKYAASSAASSTAADQSQDQLDAMLDPDIAEEQVKDPVAVLDGQLDASLAEFDLTLLQELELIRNQSQSKMQDLTAEAEAAAQRLKEQGVDLGEDESSEASQDTEPASGEQAEAASSEEEAAQTSPEGSDAYEETKQGSQGQEGEIPAGPDGGTVQGPSGTGSSAKDGADSGVDAEESGSGRRYEGAEDDDIVARQLREAAEKETDPELKKKLWEEYEAYKRDQQ